MTVYDEVVRDAHVQTMQPRPPLHQQVALLDERLAAQGKIIDQLETELARLRGILVRAAEELGIDGERG